MEKAGLKTPEDATKTLKPYRIKKDNEDLGKILTGIEHTMNPIKSEDDDNLYCIITGKKVDDLIKVDLLQCLERGDMWRQEFTQQCLENPARFEKQIPRRKLKNFAKAAERSKVTAKDQKVIELQGTRDLFGRLVYISTVEKIDMSKVFTYPLAPVPLSLAHVDRTINKTDKSKLMHKLDNPDDKSPPDFIEVTIVDAMYLLHLQQNLPITKVILHQLCCMSRRVDFVCDTYTTVSIKQHERERRGQDGVIFSITGPEQKRPKDWQQALRSQSFKMAFVRFLAEEWQNPCHATDLRGHEILLALDSTCYQFTETGGTVVREEVPLLQCHHEEADTRLIFHLMKILDTLPEAPCNIRSNDTDVMILLLYHVANAQVLPNVWLDAGLCANNTRRHINITNLVDNMDIELLDALPGLHALTGCDYTASFMNKGKVKTLDLLKTNMRFSEAVAKLGEDDEVAEEVESSIEAFICALYGKPKMTRVDEV